MIEVVRRCRECDAKGRLRRIYRKGIKTTRFVIGPRSFYTPSALLSLSAPFLNLCSNGQRARPWSLLRRQSHHITFQTALSLEELCLLVKFLAYQSLEHVISKNQDVMYIESFSFSLPNSKSEPCTLLVTFQQRHSVGFRLI